jgi:hypothetical protein
MALGGSKLCSFVGSVLIGCVGWLCKPGGHVSVTVGMRIVMSALGQKRTYAVQEPVSALPPKPDNYVKDAF